MKDKTKKQFSLSVFLPFYNEEGNIRSAITQTIELLESMPELSRYELLVVDDGSRDRTNDIAEELARRNNKIRVIRHTKNLGYGSAVLSGIRNSRYEYVFFTDGDLQFDITELKKMINYIPEYKIVVGYRQPRRDPFMRLLNAKGWNILNRLAFGLKIKDIDCAFKLFERKMVAELPLISGGAMLSAEMLIRLRKKGVEIKEIPVTHLPRKQGSPTGAKLSVIKRAFDEFWKIYKETDLGNNTYRQAFRFVTVGVINTAVDFFVYLLLTRLLPIFYAHIMLTRIFSFLSGSVCSFILNRLWTFEKRDQLKAEELIKFYSTVLMSLLIGAVSMSIFVDIFHLYDLIALVFSIFFTFVWNFSISKFWVFKQKKVDSLTQNQQPIS